MVASITEVLVEDDAALVKFVRELLARVARDTPIKADEASVVPQPHWVEKRASGISSSLLLTPPSMVWPAWPQNNGAHSEGTRCSSTHPTPHSASNFDFLTLVVGQGT